MAVQRRSSRSVSTRSIRRGTNWGRIVQNTFVSVPAATKVLVASFALSNPGIGETIRRTRGAYLVVSDQSSATERQFGAFGMIVVNDLALAAGAGSIPGPATDANDDGWFVWEPILQLSEASLGAADGAATIAQSLKFDSKAMRRVEEGFGVALMVENFNVTNALEVGLTVSMLSSLHS